MLLKNKEPTYEICDARCENHGDEKKCEGNTSPGTPTFEMLLYTITRGTKTRVVVPEVILYRRVGREGRHVEIIRRGVLDIGSKRRKQFKKINICMYYIVCIK